MSTTPSETMAYVGHCQKCDALLAAAVDEPKYARDNAKFVAQMIRDGLRVDRVSVAAVRAGAWCKCPRAKTTRRRTRRATDEQLSL